MFVNVRTAPNGRHDVTGVTTIADAIVDIYISHQFHGLHLLSGKKLETKRMNI